MPLPPFNKSELPKRSRDGKVKEPRMYKDALEERGTVNFFGTRGKKDALITSLKALDSTLEIKSEQASRTTNDKNECVWELTNLNFNKP